MQLRYKIAIYSFLFWIGMVHPGNASVPQGKASSNVVSSDVRGPHGGVQ